MVVWPWHNATFSPHYFLPAGCALCTPPTGLLCFPHLLVCWSVLCILTYHVGNNYVMFIVAMRPYFSQLRQFSWLAALCSTYSYEFEILRSRGNVDAMTWGFPRAETPATFDTYRVANRQRMAARRASALEWIETFKGLASFWIWNIGLVSNC